jgi:hypothetical protein
MPYTLRGTHGSRSGRTENDALGRGRNSSARVEMTGRVERTGTGKWRWGCVGEGTHGLHESEHGVLLEEIERVGAVSASKHTEWGR